MARSLVKYCIWKDTTTFEPAEKRPLDVTYHPPSQLLALVLSEAPALEEISFSQTVVDRWFAGSAVRLSSFTLFSIRGRITLKAPWSISELSVLPRSNPTPLYAPNLESIILDNCGSFLLRHFISPSLHHLKISGDRRPGWTKPGLHVILPSFWTAGHHRHERPPSLLSLMLEGQAIGVPDLLLLLRSSPELECLHLVCCLIRDSDKLFSRIEEEELCLLLTEIDFRELWRPADVDYESSDIYKFVETRANLPCRTPLRQALYSHSIYYDCKFEVHNLVQNLQAGKSLEPIL